MKKILCVLTLAAATPLWAADTYEIDPNHTFARFEYNHLGLSTAGGRFDKTRGTVTLDHEKKAGSVEITIDATSVNTGVEKFNDHLKGKDFFEVDKYPTITFKSDKLKFAGSKLVSVTGDLTVHGVTRPVTLTVNSFVCTEHPMKKVPACGADAVTEVKRSDFGLGLFAPTVGDQVTLHVEIEALKK